MINYFALFLQTIGMIKAMFGESFWDNVVIGVSFWKHDTGSREERNYQNKSEDWLMSQLQAQFEDKFKIMKDFKAVEL